MQEVVVIVPVHKAEPTEAEIESLEQSLRVLFAHKFVLVTHEELDLQNYKNIFDKYNKTMFLETFDKNFFASYAGYNRLCLSQEFYQRFSDYEYMLICHTDAWVFKDELLEWCSKGYDYIGAPICRRLLENLGLSSIQNAGNGGFCLRKVSSMIKLTSYNLVDKKVREYKSLKNIYRLKGKKRKLLSKIFKLFNVLFCWLFQAFLKFPAESNEDLIISYYAPKIMPEFKIAEDEVAMKFSMENSSDEWLRKNNYEIPFGSHFLSWYELLKKTYEEHQKIKENV